MRSLIERWPFKASSDRRNRRSLDVATQAKLHQLRLSMPPETESAVLASVSSPGAHQTEPSNTPWTVQDYLEPPKVVPLIRQGRFLDGTEIPMKLCTICKRLDIIQLYRHKVLAHQPSYYELTRSATWGCGLCILFLNLSLDNYSKSFGCSIQDAHQALDRYNSKYPCKVHIQKGSLDEIWLAVPYDERMLQTDSSRYFFDSQDKIATHTGPALSLRSLKANVFIKPQSLPGASNSNLAVNPDDTEGYELSRLVDFDIPKDWIRNCIEEHPNCHLYEGDPILPTRVIDVGSWRGQDQLRLFIPCGKRAPYVTLSHCWGKSLTLVTNNGNLQQHLKSIPFSLMPPLFQDAVTATRSLGYKYLWIDSLCIIQGSTEDWQLECSKMIDVYRNSTVTVVGPVASDSHTGFLGMRTPPKSDPYIWKCGSQGNTSFYNVALRWDRQVNKERSVLKEYPGTQLTDIEMLSPLERRAWTLQERLLSPRILYFGPQRMYWECNTLARFEGFRSSTVSLGRGIPKNQVLGLRDLFSRQKIWDEIVIEYSTRLLTRSIDKLPALSGVASLIWNGYEQNYIAGLTSENLSCGLSWFISDESASFNIPRPSEYRGPSWSWVSVDYPIRFWSSGRDDLLAPQRTVALRLAANPARMPRVADEGVNEKVYALSRRNKILDQAKVEIINVQVKTAEDKYRFGLIQSGRLMVRGRLKKGWVRHSYSKHRAKWRWILSDSRDEGKIAHLHPDDVASWTASLPSPLVIALQDLASRHKELNTISLEVDQAYLELESSLASQQSPKTAREILCLFIDRHRFGWYGLAVEPLQFNSNTYRRVGLIGLTEDDARSHYSTPFWFENAAEQELILI